MDNEAVRFLAAHKQGIEFTLKDHSDFANSWKTSVEENNRLITYLLKCTPHKIQHTLTLNNLKIIIVQLTKPRAEISSTISKSISNLNGDVVCEQKQITSAIANFAHFVKSCAIVPYNDALVDYLKLWIRKVEEQSKLGIDDKNEDFEYMKEIELGYREYIKLLDEAMVISSQHFDGRFIDRN